LGIGILDQPKVCATFATEEQPASQQTDGDMRQILFEIPIREAWDLGPLGQWPGFGFGLVLLLWSICGAVSVWKTVKLEASFGSETRAALIWWAGIATVIVLLPNFREHPLPVYGYGAFLVAAAVFSGWTAGTRAKLVGVEPAFARDLGMYIVLAGVVGARLFHVAQHHERVFKGCVTLSDHLITLVSLPDGGLTLYGGIIFSTGVYVLLCRRNGIDPLKFGDAVIPAVFVGIAFGRMGCLMNGCCFGDACSLPWAVTFPQGSLPWNAMVFRGVLTEDALATMPLHPTQVYSAINGLVLAAVTAVYYRYRRGDGGVIGAALMLYAVTRFCIEILRNDEFGQLGTGLTISQLVSLGTFLAGAGLAWWSWTRTGAEVPSSLTESAARPAV
jgi:phosphatidylglycerol:prolipoprotein diacylglycerol transferase